MKRNLIIILTLVAMLCAAPVAMAQDSTANANAGATGTVSQTVNNPVNTGSPEANANVGSVAAGVDAYFEGNSIYNEAADLNNGRGFAIPGEIIFPGTPGYFGEATPGHRFIPLNKLLRFTTKWDAAKAANMLNGRTGSKDMQIRDLYATSDAAPANIVYCSIASPEELGATVVDQMSIGTVAAENRKSISADVLAMAIVAASERGSNFILFMAEGVNREVDAQGWGIGFNTTQASIYSSGNDQSNISSGGFGYSRGWAGYIDYPWLQFTFLKVDGIDGLPMATLSDTGGGTRAMSETPQTSDRINPVPAS